MDLSAVWGISHRRLHNAVPPPAPKSQFQWPGTCSVCEDEENFQAVVLAFAPEKRISDLMETRRAHWRLH